jgi:hypothetical protein
MSEWTPLIIALYIGAEALLLGIFFHVAPIWLPIITLGALIGSLVVFVPICLWLLPQEPNYAN